jgi:hypothetical protein
MARVYAHMQFTDPSGEARAIGDEFDLPRETDQQKAEFERFQTWGAIGTNPPAGFQQQTDGDDSDDGQRTSPRDRRSRTRDS